jgi:hypothetical protein
LFFELLSEDSQVVAVSNPAAGKQVSPESLANIPRLITAYFASKPDPTDPTHNRQRSCLGARRSHPHPHKTDRKSLRSITIIMSRTLRRCPLKKCATM